MQAGYLVIIGSLLQLYGASFYIRGTLMGKTKPNRITWILWTASPLIAVAASLSQGATWAVLPVFMSGFCPLLVLLASFFNKNSYWKLGPLDYACGLISVAALLLWWLTDNANIAIVFSIASDIFASIPTITKSWTNPETEDVRMYWVGLANACFSLIAASSWSFAEVAFPINLVFSNILFISIISGRKNRG